MDTAIVNLDLIPLIVPVINNKPIPLPYPKYDMYPAYCGAGKGIGNLIVPEKILWLKISLACYLHDKCWEICEATWQDFHQSNSIFLHNILSIIKYKSEDLVLEHLRNYRAITYYNAVDTIGVKIFWDIKGVPIP